jgi:hypothetical protein
MKRSILGAVAVAFAVAAPLARADDDIVWLQGSGQLSYWKMEAGKRTGGGDIRTPLTPDWRLAAVADVDGDRAADMILENGAGQIAFWSKAKPQRSITNSIDRHPGPDWRLLGAGDINGDRTDDLVWMSKTGLVEYWQMRNGERKFRYAIDNTSTDWRFVGLGDLDANGSDDLVWLRDDGRMRYWPIHQSQHIGARPLSASAETGWTAIGVGDVNGDGFADILWRKPDGQLHFWAMYDGQRMAGYDLEAQSATDWTFAGVGDIDKAAYVPPALTPHPKDYSVAVETLPLAKAKGKFMETAFSVGGYTFASSLTGTEALRPTGGDPRAPWRARINDEVTYRFAKTEGAALQSGACRVRYKMWSALFDRAGSLYSCDFTGANAAGHALEVFLVPLPPPTNAMISISLDVEDADAYDARYNLLRAKMRYGGVAYEALPVGVEPKREGSGWRVPAGYTIARDGQLVGRIDFPPRKGMMAGAFDSIDRQSTITAPVSEADGREAVILFAAHLLKMPERQAE